ncbi:thioesterase domain-containing protein, partial [Streptomyces humidus]|uniref:thioesterase domain-containing protein n=1 Tax=Streptomyces humidus TaxID=52259 RepID=UPI001E62A072
VEIGPDAALTPMVQQTLPEAVCFPLQRAGQDEPFTLLSRLGQAYEDGLTVDWTALIPEAAPVDLPTYPFQHQRYWPSAPVTDPMSVAVDPAEAAFWTAVTAEDIAALGETLGGPLDEVWEQVLPVLSGWRRDQQDRRALDGLRYRMSWQRLSVSTGPLLPARRWLLLGPALPALEEAFTARGLSVETLPADAEPAALRDVADSGLVGGVVVLPSIDPAARAALAESVVNAGIQAPQWTLTMTGVAVTHDEVVDPEAAALWGQGRVLAVEAARWWGGMVDVPADAGPRAWADAVSVLLGEVHAPGDGPDVRESEVALRSDGAYAPRLVRVVGPPDTDWTPAGTVVTVFGPHADPELTAQGVGLVTDLLDRGAERVLVVGGPDDMDERAERLDFLADTPEDLGTAVGVGLDGAGAAVLDEAFASRPLTAFVLLASAASLWGEPGRSAEAIALSAQESVVRRRREQGRPGSLVALGSLPPRVRLTALADAVVTGGDTVFLADDVDWASFGPRFTELRAGAGALLAALPEAWRREQAEETPGRAAPNLRLLLAALDEPERTQAALDVVREHAAAVLGHGSMDGLTADRDLPSMGFDSLMAADFATRLSKASGVRLPASVIYDYTDLGALAAHLTERLTDSAGTAERPATTGAGTLAALFKQAYAEQKYEVGQELVGAAAQLRETFDEEGYERVATTPIRMAPGDKAPTIICFPAFTAVGGPQEYARFATALGGYHEVLVVNEPGFVAGEPVPASLDALVALHVATVQKIAADGPFVMLGRSGGGWIAHAVTRRLEELGVRPEALVLLDTYNGPEHTASKTMATKLVEQMLRRDGLFAEIDDARLTAMGAYTRFFMGWKPTSVETETVFLRAELPFDDELVGAFDTPEGWRATWDFPHVLINVPGDHFTMLEGRSDTTADALRAWLTARS